MQIPIEQLLNLPDIQVLNVEITEREIKIDIESPRSYAICHRCGQRATTFFDHGEPLVLAVLEDRTKETVVAFLQSIQERLRDTVEKVCTDLYEGFINAAAEVPPRAKVVGDRFHVAKLYRAALDDLRKKEMKELKHLLDRQEYGALSVRWLGAWRSFVLKVAHHPF